MPRHNRRTPSAARPVGGAAERRDSWRGADWSVRSVSASAAAKDYRCPGCDQLIRPGFPHVVCWPADAVGADGRRHWHTACWAARDRRGPSR